MALDQYNDEKKEPLPPNVDTETGTRRHFGNGDGKIGGRIAPVLPHLAGYDFGNDDSGSDILGKQIELEADHALKYRSCSWQKTAFLLFSEYSMFDRISHHSRKKILLILYCASLSCHYVLPIQLFSSWTRTWTYLDRCGGSFGLVYESCALGILSPPS